MFLIFGVPHALELAADRDHILNLLLFRLSTDPDVEYDRSSYAKYRGDHEDNEAPVADLGPVLFHDW